MAIDEAPQNKMLSKDDAKTTAVETVENEYFFPEYGKTVKATSQQEALAKITSSGNN